MSFTFIPMRFHLLAASVCVALAVFFGSGRAFGQAQTRRVLFLGNSYTYVNNLPQLLATAAQSVGDSVVFDSNAPGGYTLQQHAADATSRGLIGRGGWDYVVLQEQSQRPAFPLPQVMAGVFPYARQLNSLIRQANPCGQTVFYMTWGYKTGDAGNCAFWPPMCTYAGMDSLLYLRYRMLADSNRALLSPVGAVWRYLRQQHPAINLYDTDDRHPSPAGSYAAACSFYAVVFRKSPQLITFDGNLPAADAALIRAAARAVVFDSLARWHVGAYDPVAGFTPQLLTGNRVTFQNTSTNATAYQWDFGDGQQATTAQPTHPYAAPGTYTVTLTAEKCGQTATTAQAIVVGPNGLAEPVVNALVVVPNPASTQLTIHGAEGSAWAYGIHNSLGVNIRTGTLPAGGSVDIRALPDGIYFLELRANGRLMGRRKFVKAGAF